MAGIDISYLTLEIPTKKVYIVPISINVNTQYGVSAFWPPRYASHDNIVTTVPYLGWSMSAGDYADLIPMSLI